MHIDKYTESEKYVYTKVVHKHSQDRCSALARSLSLFTCIFILCVSGICVLVAESTCAFGRCFASYIFSKWIAYVRGANHCTRYMYAVHGKICPAKKNCCTFFSFSLSIWLSPRFTIPSLCILIAIA